MDEKDAMETRLSQLEQRMEHNERTQTFTSVLCWVMVAIHLFAAASVRADSRKLAAMEEEFLSVQEEYNSQLEETLQLIRERYGLQEE